MIAHDVRMALRGLRRNSGYALLNVGGLGLGLMCCFLIVLFIQHERSFDSFHADNAYLLTAQLPMFESVAVVTPAGVTASLKAAEPGVDHVVRMIDRYAAPIRLPNGDVRTVHSFTLADADVFDVFSLPMVAGDPATALTAPDGVVLTQTVARALFGDADPMGQPLALERENATLTVTGILADLPSNTHLDFGMLASIEGARRFAGPDALDDLTNWNYLTYVVLREGVDAQTVAAGVAERLMTAYEYGPEDAAITAKLRALPTLRFDSELARSGRIGARDVRLLWAFGTIALLILLIACINFTNLATARSTQRAREIGVRKSLGAERGQLVRQFLSESVLLSSFAVAIGFIGVVLALPVFNDALGGTSTLTLHQPGTLAVLGAIGLVAGLIAGTYPALYLTRFRPARVLKGDLAQSGGSPMLRRGLMVFQFTASAFLLFATLTVHGQLSFMQSQPLGFAQEQVITFEATPSILNRLDSFKRSLRDDPSVVGVAMANGLPGSVGMNQNYVWPGSADAQDQSRFAAYLYADSAYLSTVGLELAQGRWLRDTPSDVENAYVVNETAVREMGLVDPVGHAFRAWNGDESGMIVGVVKDFHFTSLKQPITPLAISYQPDGMTNVTVRLAAGSTAQGIAHVRRTFADAAPGYTLDYRFLDDDFEQQYRDEARLGTLLGFFAAMAAFIACLGIFGLAALGAQRRRKEVGVRKVLGASVFGLVALLTRDLALLVVVAIGLALPLAYVAGERWLDTFAYRMGLGVGLFVLAGATVLFVALAASGYHALRAATINPATVLRDE